jgi:hypothetical protein
MTVPAAFAQLADPYAWLLRGLISLGWEDISLTPESYPRIKGRGIDYSSLLNPASHFGLRLISLALDTNDEWYRTDGSYEYEVRLVNDPRLSFCILLRSDEMAFSRLFPWNSSQPMFVVEDIHKAIVQSTIAFIQKRKRRESISSIDLQEMLNHPIIPPPPTLLSFVGPRLHRGLNFNTAVQEGLWQGPIEASVEANRPSSLPPPTFTQPQTTAHTNTAQNTNHQAINQAPPIQSQHQFTIEAGQGRGQILGNQGLASQELSSAMVIIEPAAKMLLWVSYIGMLMGLLALVNGMFTLVMMSSGSVVRGSKDGMYLVVVVISIGLGLFGLVGGFLSHRNNPEFATLSKHPMRVFPIGFAFLYPLTWPIGIPFGLYSLYLLRKPVVRSILGAK